MNNFLGSLACPHPPPPPAWCPHCVPGLHPWSQAVLYTDVVLFFFSKIDEHASQVSAWTRAVHAKEKAVNNSL